MASKEKFDIDLTRLGHMVFFFDPQRGIFDAIL